MKIKNTIFLTILVLFFSGCTMTTYNIKDQKISFNDISKQKNLLQLDVDEDKIVYNSDSCVYFASTIDLDTKEYGKLFIEDFDLKQSCEYKGFIRGQFEFFFKTTPNINIKTFNLDKRVDVDTYEFSQYTINNKCTLNLVYIWQVDRTTLVLDHNGVFSNSLLQKLGSHENFNIEKNNCNIKYNKSMVKNNWIEGFWGKKNRGGKLPFLLPQKK